MHTLVLTAYCFFLWDISHPGKNGAPTIHPNNEDLLPCVRKSCSSTEVAIDHVITKSFRHYDIPFQITDNIRSIFTAKLWRMGKTLSKKGGTRKTQQLDSWKDGKDSTWYMTINEIEVKAQLLRKRYITEEKLKDETSKRRKFESEVNTLEKRVKKQAKEIAALKSCTVTSHHSQKSWSDCSRQQQYNKKKKLARELTGATSFCEDSGFKPCNIELKNIETGKHELIDLTTGKITKVCTEEKVNDTLHSTLYVKDKYSIADAGYHELSMLSDLPCCSQIKKLKHDLNSHYDIRKAPGDIIGTQQSLRTRLLPRLTNIVQNTTEENAPSCFHVKLTGDGTQIACGFSVHSPS